MIYTETAIAGAYLIDMERSVDERGFFSRSYDADDFAARGMGAPLTQCSVSFNVCKGTLRGLHYQGDPHPECKLVRCTAGAIFDVIVDAREGSKSLHRWFGTELSAQNRRALWIPPGCAHGFITLTDDAEVYYMIAGAYAPQSARGLRWNDPALNIVWPLPPKVISARDAAYPLLDAAAAT